MPAQGYYRYPTLHQDTLVFVSEDDLWTVPVEGSIARRLTANLGNISHPFFSPDGATLAFTSREEGHNEVYTMPSEGGPIQRLTYLGANSLVIGWTPDGKAILFSSDASQPFSTGFVQAISAEGGQPRMWPVGPAVSISITEGNRTVLGRNNNDPARWKRYRGGTAGDLWIDTEGQGTFRRLLTLKSNLARPMWLGDRIFFLSDHEGIGNLYSCTPTGEDVRRHTHQTDFFARFPSTDGQRIVYHAGADLFIYDPTSNTDKKVEVRYASPRVARQRKFVEAAKYLESYAPHPKGHSVTITTRGRGYTFGNFEGPIMPLGSDKPIPLRYRLTRYLNDGKRVVTVTDEGGEETLEIHTPSSTDDPIRLDDLDIGRAYALRVSPTADKLILSNHRHEIVHVDLESRTMTTIDRSNFRHIAGMDWSADGKWVAYGFSATQYTTAIKIWNSETGETRTVTEPVLHDTDPAFDPEGKYLYFLGQRELNPVYDNLHFDLSFPKGMRPYLLTLRADLRSPFSPLPGVVEEKTEEEKKRIKEDGEAGDERRETRDEETKEGDENPKSEIRNPKPVAIDFNGIADRVLAFPVSEGLYGQIAGLKDKVLFTSYPVEGALADNSRSPEPQARGTLEIYDLKALKHEPLIAKMSDFQLSHDRKFLYYRAGRKIRVVRAGEKPDEKAGTEPGRKSGYLNVGRVKVEVEPSLEWQQMAQETWRLQREYFWTSDMSQIDWRTIWTRYSPLVARVGTRGELSDLLWEMQGELGTSHAYEMGGDYRQEPSYPQGFLGADIAYDADSDAFTIARIVRGAAGEEKASSPLLRPGVNVREGDRIVAINGLSVSRENTPQERLVHQAESEVTLTIESASPVASEPNSEANASTLNDQHSMLNARRDVTITTLRSETPARYREWVETNRRRVHEASNGRLGYVHIPDMGANGYAEFHRLYLAEVDRDGMVVDVRYNRGGHVSSLLIEKLARRRVGYDIARWHAPQPYPDYSVAGPMVALTNQWAGSDGDIFSHVFKLLKLGPLLGKRTWGGVIGIWPRNPLADGAVTTQPEFSFWFQDVGWGVENYGTDPDEDIDIAPQDYAQGRDPQLERGIALALELLERNPPPKPDFSVRPNLAPPALALNQQL